MSNILVINSGSASLKFQLIDATSEKTILKGKADKLGLPDAWVEFKYAGENIKQNLKSATHTAALKNLFKFMDSRDLTPTIYAVGHRVAHGGELFADSTPITDSVLAKIKSLIPLAPLHNPANVLGIEAVQKINPKLPQVAVFDTAFHATMPPEAYRYAVPEDWYKKHGVRRYGFHGTSYKFITQKTAEILGKKPDKVNLIVAHIGSGASISAIKNGQSIANTMGFTPLAGLPMGTRSGNIDPSVIPFIMQREGLTADEVLSILNRQSGHKATAKVSDDMRDILLAAQAGNAQAALAYDIFVRKCAKYIGGFMTMLPRLDALIFTAGIGENGFETRQDIVQRLEIFGFKLDQKTNRSTIVRDGREGLISAKTSKYQIYTLATNEELMIARDTARIVS
ncbi:MAG: acetate kinase [Candidatus Nomurabacteria bacterium]|nr:acetate kinase [Candidatus Nomurabacteria bacterium]